MSRAVSRPAELGTLILELTHAQRRALVSLIGEAMIAPGRAEVYIDVCTDTETTPGELLALVMHARPTVAS